MIEVPELAGYRSAAASINVSTVTQARFPGEVELMAREFIACVIDAPIDDVTVTITGLD